VDHNAVVNKEDRSAEDTDEIIPQTVNVHQIGNNCNGKNVLVGSAMQRMFILITRTRNGFNASFPSKVKSSHAVLPVHAHDINDNSLPLSNAHDTWHCCRL
jgi:hypothetical protein